MDHFSADIFIFICTWEAYCVKPYIMLMPSFFTLHILVEYLMYVANVPVLVSPSKL